MSYTLPLASLLMAGLIGHSSPTDNPHRPLDRKWVITNPETETSFILASKTGPKTPWFPDLTFDLCKLAGKSWHLGLGPGNQLRHQYYPFSHQPQCKTKDWYICPGDTRISEYKCGGSNYYFCAAWGCETSYTGRDWKPSGPPDLITIKKAPLSPLRDSQEGIISFTTLGKATTGWETGKTWGLQLYATGYPGILFILKLQEQPATPIVSIGPNPVIISKTLPKSTQSPTTQWPIIFSLVNSPQTPITVPQPPP